jgi:hypothetical protein
MNPYHIVTKRLNLFEKLTHASYSELFLLWLGVNIGFAIIYCTLATVLPEHAPTHLADMDMSDRLFNSIYFSIITGTSTGYGDILPQGFSKILAMAQCISALLVFAVLVGKLVSQRQDTTLHEVHRMTFEGIFYHIRNVLFIVRKDFDAILEKLHAHKKLDEQDWKNLTTAYLQAHSLIEEIPDLYDGHGYNLHSVNLNREKLLFESLLRTLDRLLALIAALDQYKIDWKSHERSMRELRRLVDTVDAVMPVWRERSPFHEEMEFEQVFEVAAELHGDMKRIVKK